jgi:hypothetical protein
LFGPSININAGYLPNGLEIEVYIVCPENNKKNHWAWPLTTSVASKPIHKIPSKELPKKGRKPVAKGREIESHATRE